MSDEYECDEEPECDAVSQRRQRGASEPVSDQRAASERDARDDANVS